MMTTYTVRNKETGGMVTFNWKGDSPPTDADMTEVFAAAGKQALPAKPLALAAGAEFNPDMYPMDALAAKTGLSMLPTLGGVGGTVAGTALGNPWLGAIVGAGAGSAAEQFGKSMLPGGDQVPTGDRVEDVMYNMALAPLGVGAGAVVNPSAAKVAPEALAATKFAAENVLPIRLSEVKPSWITKALDDVSGAVAAGRYKNLKYAEDANGFLAKARSKVLDALLGIGSTEGVPIGAIPLKVKPSLKLNTESAYQKTLDLVNLEKEAAGKGWEASKFGNDIPIDLTNMRTAAGELMRNAAVQNAKKNRSADMAPVEWVKNFLNKSNEGMSFTGLNKLQGEINKTLYGAGDANTKMLEAFAKDLSAWDETIGGQLNGLYSVARKTAQVSMRGGLFDTVYGTLRGATKVDPNTGAEILDGGKLLATLQTPVKGSASKTPEMKIVEMLGEKNGGQIVQDLKDLANYAVYTRKMRAETGSGINLLTAVTGGASLYPKSVTGVLVPQGTSLAMTILMTAPGWKGGLRNYLLKGVKPTLRLGVQGGIQGVGSMMLDPTQGGAIPLRQNTD